MLCDTPPPIFQTHTHTHTLGLCIKTTDRSVKNSVIPSTAYNEHFSCIFLLAVSGTKGSFTWCDFRIYDCDKKWVVWMSMILFIWCDCDNRTRICVCDITHDWIPYPFYAIAMYHSNKTQSHCERIVPCERALNVVELSHIPF